MTPIVLDIILIFTMILSTWIASRRGFVREMLTIAEFGCAGLVSWKGGHLLLPLFNDLLGVTKDGGETAADVVSKSADIAANSATVVEAAHRKADLVLGMIAPKLLAQVCAYGTSFIVIFIVMMLLSFFITKSIEAAGLGYVNKGAGALFGFTRGFLLIFLPYVVCFIAFGKNLENFPAWARHSVSVPVLDKIYVSADKTLGFSKMIEDRGNALVLKIEKTKDEAKEEERELKEEVAKEEEKSGDEKK
jgi:uncharacterized membrane protein required for colicin V production